MAGNTFIISTLSCMFCLMNEVGGGKSIVWELIRAWGLLWTNKVHLVRLSSGTDIHKTSIDSYCGTIPTAGYKIWKMLFSTQFKRSLWCKQKKTIM